MLSKADVAGKKIHRLFRTAFVDSPGLDMPGIAGPIWSYRDFYVRLVDGILFRLERERLLRAEKISPDWMDVDDVDCQGETIREVVQSEHDDLYLILSSGRYLAEERPPGGNYLALDSFDHWDLEGRPMKFFRFWERTPVIPWRF